MPLREFSEWLGYKKQLVHHMRGINLQELDDLKRKEYNYYETTRNIEFSKGSDGGVPRDKLEKLMSAINVDIEAKHLELWPSSPIESRTTTTDEKFYGCLHNCREFVESHEIALEIANGIMEKEELEAEPL